MTQETIHPTISSDLLTPKEVALSLRISMTTVYRLVQRRLLPFHRIARALRFRRADIEEYVERGRVETIDPSSYGRS